MSSIVSFENLSKHWFHIATVEEEWKVVILFSAGLGVDLFCFYFRNLKFRLGIGNDFKY